GDPPEPVALADRAGGRGGVVAAGCAGARSVTVRARLLRLTARHPVLGEALLLLPAGAWLLAFFAIPLGIMATYALRPRHILGGVHTGWSTAALERLLDPIYLEVLLRSLVLAAAAT